MYAFCLSMLIETRRQPNRRVRAGAGQAPDAVADTADELAALAKLKGTERDVEARMPVKLTRHFSELAQNSEALRRIVKANPDETLNLQGSEDPGYQMDFAPVEGLLHKYEMGLLYVVSTCSAHCRFCYREELIAQNEEYFGEGAG